MMSTADYAVNLTLSVFLIVGVYQFYFWCQRNHATEPRELRLPIDDMIPYRPNWVWVYSFLYYPVILLLNWSVESSRQFNYVALSFVILLMAQMVFFVFFPVSTPEEWRCSEGRNRSERFLLFVQSMDARSNSFPSMHMSVATLTALHLYARYGIWASIFPLLIALSCLFTKQHYLIDLPAGVALGWIAFGLYELILR